MKKKSELISANEIKLASGIGIPAINHREVNSDFIENGYADVIFNNGIDAGDLIVRGSAISRLSAQFVKQGRIVALNGWFRQTNGTTEPPNTNIFTFKSVLEVEKLLPNDSLVLFNGGKNQFKGVAYDTNGISVQVSIMSNSNGDVGLYSMDAIPPNSPTTGGNPSRAYFFSLTYFTKE